MNHNGYNEHCKKDLIVSGSGDICAPFVRNRSKNLAASGNNWKPTFSMSWEIFTSAFGFITYHMMAWHCRKFQWNHYILKFYCRVFGDRRGIRKPKKDLNGLKTLHAPRWKSTRIFKPCPKSITPPPDGMETRRNPSSHIYQQRWKEAFSTFVCRAQYVPSVSNY